jgi:hypothetical protein
MQNLIHVNQLDNFLTKKGNIHRFVKNNKKIYETNERILLNQHTIKLSDLTKTITGTYKKNILVRQISDIDYERPNIFTNLFVEIKLEDKMTDEILEQMYSSFKSINNIITSIKVEINGELIEQMNSDSDIETTIEILGNIFKRDYILNGPNFIIPLFGQFNNNLINYSSNEKIKIVIDFNPSFIDFLNFNGFNKDQFNSSIKVFGTEFIFNTSNYSLFMNNMSHIVYNNIQINDHKTNYDSNNVKIKFSLRYPINLIYIFGVSIFDIEEIKFQINGHDTYVNICNIDTINKLYKPLIDLNKYEQLNVINKIETEAETDTDSDKSSHSSLYDIINDTFNEDSLNNIKQNYSSESTELTEPIIINFSSDFYKDIDKAIDVIQYDNVCLLIKFKQPINLNKLNVGAICTNILTQNNSTYMWSNVPNCKEF